MYQLIVLCLFVFTQRTSAADIRPRVFEGEVKSLFDHRYLVYFEGYVQETEVDLECSGSILTDRFIISAAHCFKDGFSHVDVIQGHVFIFTETIAEVDGSSITIHPEYEKLGNAHNLALLKTTEDIPFDLFTTPIMLAVVTPKVGQDVVFDRYGYSDVGIWMPLSGRVGLTECILNGTNILCTQRDAVEGDPDGGGALVANGGLIGVIVGAHCNIDIMQNITKCESRFVDVTRHLKWIQDVLTKE